MEEGTSSLDLFTQLQCLQLYMQLVNICNQHLIFTWKLLSLGICIVSGYAAISHFGEFPIFGVMYCVLFLDGLVIYTVIYAKAMLVPSLFDKAKWAVGQRAGRSRKMIKIENTILQKRLLAIPQMGIKVGEFHTFERTSIPEFLDYVLRNIVSMLVVHQ